MKQEILLSIISKQFLQMNKVYRYKMKKVDDMSDFELMKVCHWYCEENHLTVDFEKYRAEEEAKYRYCNLLQEYIDEELCADIQMKTAMSDDDLSKSESKCEECRYYF